MRGSSCVAIAVLLAGVSNRLTVASPPVAMPSPCPCCADGVCYPKRDTWGVYGTRWRRWPGDLRPDVPGTGEPAAEGQLPPELPKVELPRPELEDRRAPESFKERQLRLQESQPPVNIEVAPPADGGGAGNELPLGPGGPQDGFDLDLPPRPPGDGPLGPAPLEAPVDFPDLPDFQLPVEPPPAVPQGNLDRPPAPPRSVTRRAARSGAKATALFAARPVGGTWRLPAPNSLSTARVDSHLTTAAAVGGRTRSRDARVSPAVFVSTPR